VLHPCRYHAAEVLKTEGPEALQRMAMGEVIHMVQLAVTLRQWLLPHQSQWTPVKVDAAAVEAFGVPGQSKLALSATQAQQAWAKKKGLTLPAIASIVAHPEHTDLPLARSLATRDPPAALRPKRQPSSAHPLLSSSSGYCGAFRRAASRAPRTSRRALRNETGLLVDPVALGYTSIEHLLQNIHAAPASSGRPANGPATPEFATPISNRHLHHHRDAARPCAPHAP